MFDYLYFHNQYLCSMRKFLSTQYNATTYNLGLLILRLSAAGVILMNHGYQKLVNYGTMKDKFMDFMGLGTTVSLSLSLFAEFFCALLLILGLFTRFAALFLVINMGVAFMLAHGGSFADGELPFLYLAIFVAILLMGPGRISIDRMIGK